MAESELDAERIIDLLDVVHKTINLPNLAPLNAAAMAELGAIVKEITDKLEKEKAELEKKPEEEKKYG
jgi:hypothetical protein